jgi:hypothetical protein
MIGLAYHDLDRCLPERYGTPVPTAVGLASEAALHGRRPYPRFVCLFFSCPFAVPFCAFCAFLRLLVLTFAAFREIKVL